MSRPFAPAELAEIDWREGPQGSGETGSAPVRQALRATPYRWPDPRSLPTRQWLLGHWLLRGEVTGIIAPGGAGKSTISNAMALSLATGRPLLGKPVPRGPQPVWSFNLEDGLDELERQMAAACAFYHVSARDCEDRLFLDSGLIQPLCTAIEDRNGFRLVEEIFEELTATISERRIGAIFVDPLVSSHAVQENDNGAIDAITKRWKRLAQETGCAVALVHHTKKMGGREVTAEDGRGGVALRDAARVMLTLNPMSPQEAEELGISDPDMRRALVRIDEGKSSRAPPGAATWIKLESQSLDNGAGFEPSDMVGVAALWNRPDVLHGITTEQLHQVQKGLAEGEWRESVQSKDWVGFLVAKVTGLSVDADKARIKAMIKSWRRDGAITVERRADKNGDDRPFVIAGKPVDLSAVRARPHFERCGAESAEGADDDPL